MSLFFCRWREMSQNMLGTLRLHFVWQLGRGILRWGINKSFLPGNLCGSTNQWVNCLTTSRRDRTLGIMALIKFRRAIRQWFTQNWFDVDEIDIYPSLFLCRWRRIPAKPCSWHSCCGWYVPKWIQLLPSRFNPAAIDSGLVSTPSRTRRGNEGIAVLRSVKDDQNNQVPFGKWT